MDGQNPGGSLQMIADVNGINTKTPDGKLALALLAIITSELYLHMTPDEVISKANKLFPAMFRK
jgi:hypothetical protein